MSVLHTLTAISNAVETRSLPVPEKRTDESWQAVAFMLESTKLLISMGQISEVLTCPPITRLPGVKPWVVGVANVRGDVLPIFDLNGFFTGRETRTSVGSQLIAIEHKGARYGLVVSRMVGMRQVTRASQHAIGIGEHMSSAFGECISGAAYLDNGDWLILDADKLINHEDFQQVAE